MPRKVDPSKIRTGSGEAPAERDNLELGSLGQVVISPGAAMDALKGDDWGLGGSGDGLTAHLDDTKDAHPASAISIDNEPRDVYTHHNVEDALDELSALLPPKPPSVGNWHPYMEITGIPDWGLLKLNDASYKHRWTMYPDASVEPTPGELIDRNQVLWSLNRSGDIYPYYHYVGPGADNTPVFEPGSVLPANTYTGHADNSDFGGNDPEESGFWSPPDPLFNILDISGDYLGGGIGRTYFGAYARDTVGGGEEYKIESYRILDTGHITGAKTWRHPATHENVSSGMLYPADRGVLALVHWPPGSGVQNHVDPSDEEIQKFLSQNLEERCPAAILLGQGILNETPELCDGSPGGIFFVGTNMCCEYDPYQFPGQATGQYALREISSGHDMIHNERLPDHTGECEGHYNFHDLDGDGIHGWQRVEDEILPGPGQVRLGTHPSAGVPTHKWGVPILGATHASYRSPTGNPLPGKADNFFRFRLPYMMDYTKNTGLIYTPIDERDRYRFLPELHNSTHPAVLADENPKYMDPAGDYPGFVKDYYPYQVSRYRHQFKMHENNDNSEVGSYIFIHFKKEEDFEAYVRDGIMPGQIGEECRCEYTVYSASLAIWENPEDKRNWGDGNAPGSYHVLRTPIRIDEVRTFKWGDFSHRGYTLTSNNGDDNKTWVSGVAYFQPWGSTVPMGTDPQATAISDLRLRLDASFGFFNGAYRDWSRDKRGPFPAFLNTAVFRWGEDRHDVVDCGEITHDDGEVGDDSIRNQRTCLTTGMISSSSRGFPNTNTSPEKTDDIEITSGEDLVWNGDVDNPSFSSNAKLRAFFRMPVGHRIEGDQWPQVNMPTTGVPIDHTDEYSILYHTARYNEHLGLGGAGVRFGNYKDGVNPVPSLFSGAKDVSERFLDEVYRYRSDFNSPGVSDNEKDQLIGPGLPHGSAPISLTIKPLPEFGWVHNDFHVKDLIHDNDVNGATSPVKEGQAQVGGIPDRNPPISDGVLTPTPSSGLLLYPQKNYSEGYRPNVAIDAIGLSQPDYTLVDSLERVYYRVFDANFTESWTVIDEDRVFLKIKAEGQPFIRLRLDGITLEDFEYRAPGPGSRSIAIMVKVPGLTTWMDAGRYDGSGPSKQDPMLDGAGCCVLGMDTGNSIDPVTGIVFCTLKVNVGSTANFFMNDHDKVPVLIKVILRPPSEHGLDKGPNDIYGSLPYNFECRFIHGEGWTYEVSPDISSTEVRGLCGIRLLHPDESSASSFSIDMYKVGSVLTPPSSAAAPELSEVASEFMPMMGGMGWKDSDKLKDSKKSVIKKMAGLGFSFPIIGTHLDKVTKKGTMKGSLFEALAMKFGSGRAIALLETLPWAKRASESENRDFGVEGSVAELKAEGIWRLIRDMGIGATRNRASELILPDGFPESGQALIDRMNDAMTTGFGQGVEEAILIAVSRMIQVFGSVIKSFENGLVTEDQAEEAVTRMMNLLMAGDMEAILDDLNDSYWDVFKSRVFKFPLDFG